MKRIQSERSKRTHLELRKLEASVALTLVESHHVRAKTYMHARDPPMKVMLSRERDWWDILAMQTQ